jgi:hypothetical protein
LSSSTTRIHLLLCPSIFLFIFTLYLRYLLFLHISFTRPFFISAIAFCHFLPHSPLTAINFIRFSLAGTRTKYIPNANQVCYRRFCTKYDTQ